MIFELKPSQQQVLDRAAKSGMSPDEVLDQAFAMIGSQYQEMDWMAAKRDAISAWLNILSLVPSERR